MSIVQPLVTRLKKLWSNSGYHETGELGLHQTSIGTHGVRLTWRVNKFSTTPPLCIVVSHIENSYEMHTLLQLGSKLQTVFPGSAMPAIEIYAAQNDHNTLHRDIVTELKEMRTTGIVAIGALASQAIGSEHQYRPFTVPVYLSDIPTPDMLPALHRQHAGRKMITCVGTKAPSYDTLLRSLKDTCPNRTRALIVRGRETSSGTLAMLGATLDKRQQVRCWEYGIRPVPLFLPNGSDVTSIITKALRENDIIIIANDSLAMANLTEIVRIGDATQTPIITHNLSGIRAGCVLGFGAHEATTAAALAQAITNNLLHGIQPGAMKIPMVHVPPVIRFNQHKLESQGLRITPAFRRAMDMTEITWE